MGLQTIEEHTFETHVTRGLVKGYLASMISVNGIGSFESVSMKGDDMSDLWNDIV